MEEVKNLRIRNQDLEFQMQSQSKKLFSTKFDAGLTKKMYTGTREALRKSETAARLNGKQASDLEHIRADWEIQATKAIEEAAALAKANEELREAQKANDKTIKEQNE